MPMVRPAQFCRSWLFLEGANEAALQRATTSGADVLIQELEDFTPAPLRPAARALAPELYHAWREAGAVIAGRINPLEQDGMDDLAAGTGGRPRTLERPKAAQPGPSVRLAEALRPLQGDCRNARGSLRLWP